MPITEPIDEDELEADLAALEQENLDEKMLKTGTVPQDQLQRTLPAGVNGECECPWLVFFCPRNGVWKRWLGRGEQGKGITVWWKGIFADLRCHSERENESAGTSRGRRRGRGTTEAAGGNGDVVIPISPSLPRHT